jgi:hypothetical protein
MNKKGEGMSTQKIVTLVIVIIVLIAIVFFLNKANLTQWVKNLPGYSSGEDKDVDVTETSDVARALSCTIKVGRTKSDTAAFGRSKNSISIYNNGVLQLMEDIYWYVGLQTIEDIKPMPDVVLGSVTPAGGNYKISLNSLGKSYPLVSNLDGAYFISGTGEICQMGTAQTQQSATATGN